MVMLLIWCFTRTKSFYNFFPAACTSPPSNENLMDYWKVMRREAKVMRGEGDTVFAQVKKGDGVEKIKTLILADYEATKKAEAAAS